MLRLQNANEEEQQKDQEYKKQTSLSIIPMQSEKVIGTSQSQLFGYKSKLVSMDCIPFSNSPKKKLRQRLKEQDFAKITSTYMKRGTLDSDLLNIKNEEQLSEKDYIIYEILRRNVVDVSREEDSNMAIYILRKVTRNNLEMQFLKKVIESISLFKKNPDLSKNCSNQILMRISHSFYKKNQVIFNYGSAYCLIPNKDYGQDAVDSQKQEDIDQKDKQQTQLQERQNTQSDTARNRKKLVIGGQPNIKRLKSQEDDLHEFDLESGAYEPPKSPLKRNKLLLKPNRSQSFSDDEEEDEFIKKKQKEENRKLIKQNYPEFDIIKELKQGESFGEIAVLTGEKRTATLICSDDTHLLALSKKGFDTILGAYKQFIMQDTVEFLRKFPFLKSIPSSQLLSLFQSMKEEKYVTGNPIFTEKDPCNCIYFIKSGEIEISKEVITDQQNDDDSELNEFRRKANSEIEKNTIYNNFSKKKNKQRMRLYQLGPYSYFGAQEIMKKLPLRETQAKCISQEAIIYSIEKKEDKKKGRRLIYSFQFILLKKKFFVFMKVHKHFTIFKREIQIKMDWEEERDKKIINKAQLSKMLIHSNSATNNRILKSEDTLRKSDIFQSKFSTKESDSTHVSQQNTMTTLSIKNQRKSHDVTQTGGFFKSELQPVSEYFSQQSFRQAQTLNQIQNDQDLYKSQQLAPQPEIHSQKATKGKLPILQSNFIDTLQKKSQRSNSLNQLITRQNKPMIEALINLKNQGFDITQLSKLSADELKDLTKKCNKNLTMNTNTNLTGSRRSLLLKVDQQDDSQNNSKERNYDPSQSFKQTYQVRNDNKNNDSSGQLINSNNNSNGIISSQSANNISLNQNKSKITTNLKNIDLSGSSQTSSKTISQLIRKSFDYTNTGMGPSGFFLKQINNKFDSPNSSKNKLSSHDTPPKSNVVHNYASQSYTPDNHQAKKEAINQQTLMNGFGNYSIFNANKPRSNTDQFSTVYRSKNPSQPLKGLTLYNDRQSSPHYKFEEELVQRNKKQNKNKDYFEKDLFVQNNNNTTTSGSFQIKHNIGKQMLTSGQRFSLNDCKNPLFSLKNSESTDFLLQNKKSPREINQ